MKTLTTFAALLLAAPLAWADGGECITDDDCPAGFACDEVMMPCAAPACDPDDGDCGDPEECEPESYGYCYPAACETDADCGPDLECVTFEYTVCSTVEVSPPDSAGDSEPSPARDAADPDCETEAESFCAPAWAAECAVDADCGAGFTCLEMEECVCSGGGSTGTDSGGEPSDATPGSPARDEADEDSCECTGTGTFFCMPDEIECEEDSECPEEWTCEDLYGGDVSVDSGTDSGDVPPPEPMDPEPMPSDPSRDEVEVSGSMCMPPHFMEYIGYAADAGIPMDPRLEDSDIASGQPSGGEGDELDTDGGGDDDADDTSDDDALIKGDGSDDGGCRSVPLGTVSPLLLLGLVALRRRH